MRFQAAIFDLDGTLLDTLDDIADSTNRALEAHGFGTHEVGAYRNFIGDGVSMLVERSLPPDRRDVDTTKRVLETMRLEYSRGWKVKTRPYPGVPAMLDAAAARGLGLAVLSNKPHEFTLMCVEELLSSWTFAAVIGQRPGLPQKPDPAGARMIAGIMGTPPERIVFVGDSGIDMRTASAAGMHAVGALWGFRPRDELERFGAREFAARPEDVVSIFDSDQPT